MVKVERASMGLEVLAQLLDFIVVMSPVCICTDIIARATSELAERRGRLIPALDRENSPRGLRGAAARAAGTCGGLVGGAVLLNVRRGTVKYKSGLIIPLAPPRISLLGSLGILRIMPLRYQGKSKSSLSYLHEMPG